MSAHVEWTEPPEAKAGSRVPYFDGDTRAMLMQHKGKWARIATRRTSANGSLARKHPDFQFTTRVVAHDPDGKPLYDIYARYYSDGSAL